MKNLRTKFTAFLVGFAFVISGAALAETFNLFQPATGILKGNSRSYVTTAANASDVVALWSGTCSASTFLAGNGTCQPEAGGGTVTSITAGTGIALTPSPITTTGSVAINQAFNPTWTGVHAFAARPRLNVAAGEQMMIGGVVGAADPYLGFYKQDGSTRVGYVQGVEAGSLRIAADPGNSLDLRSNGTSRIVINSNGSFSIGGGAGTAGQVLTSAGSSASPTWTTIAAGGTPGGANTQIQYNNAGAFAGSAKFAWDDGSNRLTIGPTTGPFGATITPPVNSSGTASAASLSILGGSVTGGNTTGAGGGVTIGGGSPNGANFGGSVTIQGGQGSFSQNAGGGSVEITGGEGNGTAQAGSVYITGGAPSGTGVPGDIGIQAGHATEQRGGSVEITAGDANSQGAGNFNGGNVTISAGAGIGTGTGGNVSLNAGNGAFIVSTNGTNRFFINPSGSWGLAGGVQGTTGQVLTSQGTGAAPIWSTPAGGGANSLPVRTFTTTDSTVAADCGKAIIFNGGASQTFTLNATPPVNCVLTFINNSTSPVTLAGSGSLTWLNGSGVNATGNRTIAGGGVLTATTFTTAGQWYIWGSGAL